MHILQPVHNKCMTMHVAHVCVFQVSSSMGLFLVLQLWDNICCSNIAAMPVIAVVLIFRCITANSHPKLQHNIGIIPYPGIPFTDFVCLIYRCAVLQCSLYRTLVFKSSDLLFNLRRRWKGIIAGRRKRNTEKRSGQETSCILQPTSFEIYIDSHFLNERLFITIVFSTLLCQSFEINCQKSFHTSVPPPSKSAQLQIGP